MDLERLQFGRTPKEWEKRAAMEYGGGGFLFGESERERERKR